MDIRLVSDIPYQFILGKIETQMQRHGKLHGSQIGRQMAAGTADTAHQLKPDLLCQFPVILWIYIFNIIFFYDLFQ